MKNRWNLFWKDYANLATDSIRFCRKHWLGTLVYLAIMALYITGCLTGWLENLYYSIAVKILRLKAKVKSIFVKGKHEK